MSELGVNSNSVLEYVSDGVALYETDGEKLSLVYCNNTMCRMLGYSHSVYTKKAAGDIFFAVVSEDKEKVHRVLSDSLALTAQQELVARYLKSDGGIIWARTTAKPFTTGDGVSAVAVTFSDVTDEVTSKEELRFRADHDSLTGIYNANAFYRNTKELLTRSEEEYVLVRLNIVRFKVVNDIFGSKVADDILITFADTLVKSLKGLNCSYGRLTADHFALCMAANMFSEQRLVSVIRDIRSDLPPHYNVNIKAGIYRITNKDIAVSVMCDRAKLAMQTIKDDNLKLIAYYDDDIRKNLLREQRIESEMQWALDSEQFEVWFQPIYSLSSMQPYSAEALVRWRHPTKGLISPGMFIPVFEKNGFIAKLDYYIFDHVCAYIRQRREKGLKPIPISVNVSRMSLYKSDLAEDIINLVESYGLSPELFKIEITETAYSNNPTIITNTVNKLRSYGFTILMDDFGSGYSSLNILKDLPIDVLKIDMNFMADLNSTDKAANILTSIVRMAKWLDMPCIAEGVETAAQVHFLKSIGCDNIQGFYFSRPLPCEDFEKIVEENFTELDADRAGSNGIKDVDSMLSGNETVTKLMNSMFGAMGFYEFEKGRLEVLRVNEGYYRTFGYKLSDFAKDAKDVLQKIHSDDVELVLDACKETIATKKTVHRTVRRYDAKGKILYINASFNNFGGTPDKPLLCIAFNDITAHKMLERKSSEKMKLLNILSRKLLERTDIDAAIDEILKMVRRYYKAERAIIYEIDHDRMISYAAYEQCASHIDGRKGKEGAKPIVLFRDWVDYLSANKFIRIDDISHGRTILPGFSTYLSQLGINSVIAVPVITNRKMTGCICIDNPRDNIDQVDFLQSFSDYYSLEMMKYRMQQKTESFNKRMNAIMENMDGGVGLFRFGNDDIFIDFGTERFFHILDTEPGLKASFFTLVNTLDRDEFKVKVLKAISSGERLTTQFRLAGNTKDGKERWLSFSGSTMYNPETGEPIGIAVINDITDRIYSEQSRYSAALTSVYDRIYRVDMVNSRIELLSARTRDDEAVHRLLDVFSGEGQESRRKWLAKICKEAFVKQTASADYEVEIGGKMRYYTCTAVRFTETVFLLCLMDCTSAKMAQALQLENQKLRIKERFQETSNIYVRQTGIVLLEYDYETKLIESTENFSRFAVSSLSHDDVFKGDESFRNSVHPDDIEIARELFLTQKNNHSAELRFLDTYGKYVWCQVLKTISFDKNSNPLYANYTILDINERKNSEASIKKASEMMQNVVNSANSGIAFVEITEDREIIPIFRNGKYYDLLGYDKEYYDDNNLVMLDLIDDEDTEAIKDKLIRTAYEGEVFASEFKVRYKDGSSKWIRCEFAPYISGDKEIDGRRSIIILTDVTELYDRTVKLNAVINSVPGGVAQYRVYGNRVESEFYSESLPKLWGYGGDIEEYERIVKTDLTSLIYHADKERVIAAMTYLVKTGENVRIGFRINCRNQEHIWVTLSALKLSDNDDGSSTISCLYTMSSERELMYRRILDESSNGVYVFDAKKHNTLYVNRTLRRMLSIPAGTDTADADCFSALSGGNEHFADEYAVDRYTTRMLSLDGKKLFIKGRRFEWNGIPSVIEYISEQDFAQND
ncbi:MAG: EAL domain-containing protein [Oscillospiraceae bacterium]|nr:EAL domain-containing protein [Oscillospiraceae bacterium]